MIEILINTIGCINQPYNILIDKPNFFTRVLSSHYLEEDKKIDP